MFLRQSESSCLQQETKDCPVTPSPRQLRVLHQLKEVWSARYVQVMHASPAPGDAARGGASFSMDHATSATSAALTVPSPHLSRGCGARLARQRACCCERWAQQLPECNKDASDISHAVLPLDFSSAPGWPARNWKDALRRGDQGRGVPLPGRPHTARSPAPARLLATSQVKI
jgi:hypothetical protein